MKKASSFFMKHFLLLLSYKLVHPFSASATTLPQETQEGRYRVVLLEYGRTDGPA